MKLFLPSLFEFGKLLYEVELNDDTGQSKRKLFSLFNQTLPSLLKFVELLLAEIILDKSKDWKKRLNASLNEMTPLIIEIGKNLIKGTSGRENFVE